MQERPTTSAINVRFFPDYRDSNPYQQLLYTAAAPRVHAMPIATVADLAAGDWQKTASILHLHWEVAPFLHGEMTPEGFLDLLSGFRAAGGRVVWTIHNLAPHDQRHRAAAAAVRDGVLAISDILHLHSLPAVAAVQQAGWLLPEEKLRVIPHPSYTGAYPVFTRAAARAALGLDAAGRVVLLPGQIRDYKAPGALARAFLEVAGPEDRLLLCGHMAGDVDTADIPDDDRIIAQFGFAPAEEVSQSFAASDFAILPYRQSLTSGTAVLAQTLGRGVLGSDTPGLRDVVSMPRNGILYDPEPPGALRDALAQALAEPPEVWAARGRAAAEDVLARSPAMLGATWATLFAALAARAPVLPRRGEV